MNKFTDSLFCVFIDFHKGGVVLTFTHPVTPSPLSVCPLAFLKLTNLNFCKHFFKKIFFYFFI